VVGDALPEGERERTLVVGVQFAGASADAAEQSLDELASLVWSAGGEVAGRLMQRRDKPDPATFVGKGKAAEAAEAARDLGAETTVFDEELSPGQLRNLEELIPGKVIDRTILILDIFAQRAHSLEGKTQVELAQLTYGLPRLRGWGQALSRIGGTAGAGGGRGRGPIGTRGPGETQLEVDRRKIERRMKKLRRDLQTLSKRRHVMRRRRQATVPGVSLVGYTNSGKSTLLNRLTDSAVVVEDRLFSTLDPTTRRLRLRDGRPIVVSDTVGFIRKLPHGLVEAFKSTLEEVSSSDVLVHLVDSSRPAPEHDMQSVDEVLAEIDAMDAPRVVALNKIDLLEAGERDRLRKHFPGAVEISAATGAGIDELLDAIASRLDQRVVEVEALLPYDRGALLASLHDQGRVLRADHESGGVRVLVRARSEELAALDPYLVAAGSS
jgi:GTP-binding protein HflX